MTLHPVGVTRNVYKRKNPLTILSGEFFLPRKTVNGMTGATYDCTLRLLRSCRKCFKTASGIEACATRRIGQGVQARRNRSFKTVNGTNVRDSCKDFMNLCNVNKVFQNRKRYSCATFIASVYNVDGADCFKTVNGMDTCQNWTNAGDWNVSKPQAVRDNLYHGTRQIASPLSTCKPVTGKIFAGIFLRVDESRIKIFSEATK